MILWNTILDRTHPPPRASMITPPEMRAIGTRYWHSRRVPKINMHPVSYGPSTANTQHDIRVQTPRDTFLHISHEFSNDCVTLMRMNDLEPTTTAPPFLPKWRKKCKTTHTVTIIVIISSNSLRTWLCASYPLTEIFMPTSFSPCALLSHSSCYPSLSTKVHVDDMARKCIYNVANFSSMLMWKYQPLLSSSFMRSVPARLAQHMRDDPLDGFLVIEQGVWW